MGAAKAEAVNRAFVNSLVKTAIDMLKLCDGAVTIRINQLPEGAWYNGYWKPFTTKDLAKEVGISPNGCRETYPGGYEVLWYFQGDNLIGEVRKSKLK